jgi:hypothetical protein
MVSWWLEALDGGAWRDESADAQWRYYGTLVEPERQLSGLVSAVQPKL